MARNENENPVGALVAGSTLNVTLRLTRDPTKGSTLRRAKTTQAKEIEYSSMSAMSAAAIAQQETEMRQRRLVKSLARREKRAHNESLILAVRRLKGEAVIDGTIAQFYEGM